MIDTGVPEPPAAPVRSDVSGDPVVTLWWLLALGLVMQFVGGLIIGAAWPSVPMGFDAETADEGSSGGLLFGWLLGGAGTMVTMVAVIGFGTMLGIRAARQQR